ncbi:MAG: hypothetical protein JO107_08015, partial [Hyphomicrobiales bacterium]|nr:hypothetical protein [Hyphomicrobiales bacterium]
MTASQQGPGLTDAGVGAATPAGHLRDLASVSAILNTATAMTLQERFGRLATTEAIRAVLSQARMALRAGASSAPSADDLASLAQARLEAEDVSAL